MFEKPTEMKIEIDPELDRPGLLEKAMLEPGFSLAKLLVWVLLASIGAGSLIALYIAGVVGYLFLSWLGFFR